MNGMSAMQKVEWFQYLFFHKRGVSGYRSRRRITILQKTGWAIAQLRP